MAMQAHDKVSQDCTYLDRVNHVPSSASKRRRYCIGIVLSLLLFSYFTLDASAPRAATQSSDVDALTSDRLAERAWFSLRNHIALLDVPGITHGEFLHRQSVLAAALHKAGIDAFIAEPSASSSYYANISSSYELSERPFLILFDHLGHFSYLAPKFELDRIARLDMAYDHKSVFEWSEEESPFSVLKQRTNFTTVMLDEHARYMIASGLQGEGITVVPMSFEVQSIRAIKSIAEIDILRGINAFTVELVRALQKQLKVGMTQDAIVSAAHSLFTQAGIGSGFWAIVLFGAAAAQPHGGETGLTLHEGEFVLIDIGSSLHDYGSDVTRTVLPPTSKVSDELMTLWETVLEAQSAAIDMMWPNTTCSSIDAASRQVITDAGLGPFYTHRLGHGLGLEMHEHPYLNGANQEPLRLGNVVTNEPGIYVTQKQARQELGKSNGFGIRIEDAVLVTESGGVVLTKTRATSPYHP